MTPSSITHGGESRTPLRQLLQPLRPWMKMAGALSRNPIRTKVAAVGVGEVARLVPSHLKAQSPPTATSTGMDARTLTYSSRCGLLPPVSWHPVSVTSTGFVDNMPSFYVDRFLLTCPHVSLRSYSTRCCSFLVGKFSFGFTTC